MRKTSKRNSKTARVIIIVSLILMTALVVYEFIPKQNVQMPESVSSVHSTLKESFGIDSIVQKIKQALHIENVEEITDEDDSESYSEEEVPDHTYSSVSTEGEFDLSAVPAYSGSPYVVINNNEPYFTSSEIEEMSEYGFEYYAPLDNLGRCGVTAALIGEETMPTEKRGDISKVKPSGWNNSKTYSFVDGQRLYNRCHLIGFQLAGENANDKNLITGTRYLNVDGMLPFENEVADYVHSTKNHVFYRVTPYFDGENLVADGVLMEAKSLEDHGNSVQFCVFCYNVQPGVVIDYKTGNNWAE